MIKRFIIAFILVVLVGGGLVGFNMFRSKAIEDYFANAPRPVLVVSATPAPAVTWKPSIAAIGTVSAANGVELSMETTGIVTDILFKANDNVEKGAVLVQLDDTVQKADLAAARTDADLNRQALERANELQRRGVGSSVNADNALAASQASAAQVDKLQAVLDQKKLRSPFSGTIGIPRIDIGQYVAPGTTVATLQDIKTMHADFTIPEQELNNLDIGQAVRLGLGNGPLAFEGKISGIDPKVDPQTRLVHIRAEIENSDNKLTPGQFVQVEVALPEQKNVIALPQTSVVTSLYGDYVYVVRPMEEAAATTPAAEAKPATPTTPEAPAAGAESEPKLEVRQVFVKVGRRSGPLVEIVEGVKLGEEVVTAGQNRLSNRSPVRIDNSVDPSRPVAQEASAQ